MSYTFADEIRKLRRLKNVLGEYKGKMDAIHNNSRFSRHDREFARSLSEFLQAQQNLLTESTNNIANLAIVHSSEPHDKILKALSE